MDCLHAVALHGQFSHLLFTSEQQYWLQMCWFCGCNFSIVQISFIAFSKLQNCIKSGKLYMILNNILKDKLFLFFFTIEHWDFLKKKKIIHNLLNTSGQLCQKIQWTNVYHICSSIASLKVNINVWCSIQTWNCYSLYCTDIS